MSAPFALFRVKLSLECPDDDPCAWAPDAHCWCPISYPLACGDQTGFQDTFGAGCNEYAANPNWCDVAELMANDQGLDGRTACCVCGGGADIPPVMTHNCPECADYVDQAPGFTRHRLQSQTVKQALADGIFQTPHDDQEQSWKDLVSQPCQLSLPALPDLFTSSPYQPYQTSLPALLTSPASLLKRTAC